MWQGKKVCVTESVPCAYAPSWLIHEELAKKIECISRGGGEEVAKGRSWELSDWHVIWQFGMTRPVLFCGRSEGPEDGFELVHIALTRKIRRSQHELCEYAAYGP